MGSASRIKPAKLGEKLLMIRQEFKYSLSQMAAALSDEQAKILKQAVSKFEKGEREPNLIILLRYATMAGVTMEMLVNDEVELKKIGLNT